MPNANKQIYQITPQETPVQETNVYTMGKVSGYNITTDIWLFLYDQFSATTYIAQTFQNSCMIYNQKC